MKKNEKLKTKKSSQEVDYEAKIKKIDDQIKFINQCASKIQVCWLKKKLKKLKPSTSYSKFQKLFKPTKFEVENMFLSSKAKFIQRIWRKY